MEECIQKITTCNHSRNRKHIHAYYRNGKSISWDSHVRIFDAIERKSSINCTISWTAQNWPWIVFPITNWFNPSRNWCYNERLAIRHTAIVIDTVSFVGTSITWFHAIPFWWIKAVVDKWILVANCDDCQDIEYTYKWFLS